MSKNEKSMPLYRLVVYAFLVALSIVCGKFIAIPVGEILRFSFENLPVLFAGVIFGPVAGMMVGASADLLGCVLRGYAVNPWVTAGAVLIGLIAGLGGVLLRRFPLRLQVAVIVLVAHLIGSVVIKTIGLATYYAFPLWELALWRLLNYTIVGTAEAMLLYLLLRHPGVRRFCPERRVYK